MNNKIDFGFRQVDLHEKQHLVKGVFDSVAGKYDLMNDLMSLGIHRLWKDWTVFLANIAPNARVLDLAGGTGDIAARIAKKLGDEGHITLCDINESMLRLGRERLIADGLAGQKIDYAVGNAESLPFPEASFSLVTMAFGLRNVTHKQAALNEIFRVLRPGGQVLILEFSKVHNPVLAKLYDSYSFTLLPKLGEIFAKDRQAYQYLAESIRMHPDQETLKTMMEASGFKPVTYNNLTAGVVALHRGHKP